MKLTKLYLAMCVAWSDLNYFVKWSDEDGNILVSQMTGEPKHFLRGHDVEEFHGVVQRYGASESVQKMVELANDGPAIGKAKIAHACGTCLLKLA